MSSEIRNFLRLLSAPKRSRLSLRSPGENVLAAADVEIDEAGSLYVLDDRKNRVVVFDSLGAWRYSFGGPGIGRGHFVEPRAIAVSTAGQLVVGDFTRRIEVFTSAANSRHAVESSIPTSNGIEDLCFLGEELIAHSRSSRRIELLSAYGMANGSRRYFGVLYRSPNARINAEIARGRIVCATEERIVAHIATSALPELRGYTTDGHLRWRTRLDGFRTVDIVQPAGRPQSIRVSVPAKGLDRVVALLYARRVGIVLQIAREYTNSSSGTSRTQCLTTLVVRPSDGRVLFKGDTLPLIRAMGNRMLVVARSPSSPELTTLGVAGFR